MRKNSRLQAALALQSHAARINASLDAQAPLRVKVTLLRREEAEARREQFLNMRRLPPLELGTVVLTANTRESEVYGFFAKLEFAPLPGRPRQDARPDRDPARFPNDEKYFHSDWSRADAISKARSWAADHLSPTELIDLTCLTPSSTSATTTPSPPSGTSKGPAS